MKFAKEQYVFINIGRIAGKLKFCMLDKELSYITDQYELTAQRWVGDEGRHSIQVVAEKKDESMKPQLLSQIIWSVYHPLLSTAAHISHINGNTMDNRHVNLTDQSQHSSPPICDMTYWNCLDPVVYELGWQNPPDCLLLDGHSSHPANQKSDLIECHYLPCTNLESIQFQFDMCGQCCCVRYCSSACQQLDWPLHRLHCEMILSVQSCPTSTSLYTTTTSKNLLQSPILQSNPNQQISTYMAESPDR